MSMSPPNPSPAGALGRTPNGLVSAAQRRPKPRANPMVADRRNVRRPARPIPGAPEAPTSSARPVLTSTSSQAPARPTQPRSNGKPAITSAAQVPKEPEGEMTNYPLYTTKRVLLLGQRYHVMKVVAKARVDIRDQQQFVRPVQLHRRDPRFNNDVELPLDGAKDDAVDAEERERQELIKQERKRIREENQAQIAPTGRSTKPQAFQKKTEQHFGKDGDPVQQKARELRYEESLPWHLEDFGSDRKSKQILIGQYEAALSENHIAFVPAETAAGAGMFTVVPLEKWYRFKEKPKFKTFTAEEREAIVSSKVRPARWEMREKMARAQEREVLAREGGVASSSMALRRGDKNELMVGSVKPKKEVFKREGLAGGDEDNIDFNIDEEFADDEENELFEGDDDQIKEAEDKIRKEQLTANTFDNIDKKAVEEEEERERHAAAIQRALEKSTRKALLKRERNYDYEDDSDGNPYASKSESEDSDAERVKEEERKKEEGIEKADKSPSAISSKGTNTPSGRPARHDAPAMQKSLSTTSLKRPNSPNASDLSGNESSRKKQKKAHLPSASSAVPRATSPGESRQLLVSARAGINVKRRPAGGAGSGSDTDSIASGAQKVRRPVGSSPKGTPAGSRATSPTPATNAASKSGSPGITGPVNAATVDIKPGEILALVPPEGLPVKALINQFPGRVTKDNLRLIIQMIRKIAYFDGEAKRIFRKEHAPVKAS